MADNDRVILVDKSDRPIGTEDKVRAHQNGGILHRAFSVFVFNSRGETLLQRRAARKYHFGGLWSNACCSHPRPGEETEQAAKRRLMEELGLSMPLRALFTFVYQATDPHSDLSENELDHVLVGTSDTDPTPNVDEIDDWRWADPATVVKEMTSDPTLFTPWFAIALPRVMRSL